VSHQVVEHVLNAAPPAQVTERLEQAEAVEARPDQEHDEVAVDLGHHPAARDICHESLPAGDTSPPPGRDQWAR
jgi:hypothetical protein